MQAFLRRQLRRAVSILLVPCAALGGFLSASAAPVTYEFNLLAQYQDKVPVPEGTFDLVHGPIPLFGVFDEANSPIGQTFHARLTLAQPLAANRPFAAFDDSLVLGFSAQIGNEVWGADSALTVGRAYETDASGALTKIVFDFRNANGNGLTVMVDQWRTLWMATQFYFPGYDEPWQRGMCAVDNHYGFSGTCFGGRDISWAVVPPGGEGEDPPPVDPPGSNQVPEPASLALACTALAGAFWGSRRGRRTAAPRHFRE